MSANMSVNNGGGAAISIRDLRKTFGNFHAVDGISFDVARGEVFGFLGPNGSGKTTTIRMLTGSLQPTSGSIEVLGTNVVRHPARIASRIGYMSQRFSLFEDLTVDENLRFYGGVYDLEPAEFARQREYVLDMAGLRGHENDLTGELSTGWKQRLALGAATMHRPELLFLDEPTSGVDPVARRRFWDLLYDLSGQGVTLFVTTHYMEEATNCSRLAFMYDGRVIADGSPSEIRQRHAVDGVTPSLEDVFVELVSGRRGP
jgi:ABC-2 type transport system ATP-binding protein